MSLKIQKFISVVTLVGFILVNLVFPPIVWAQQGFNPDTGLYEDQVFVDKDKPVTRQQVENAKIYNYNSTQATGEIISSIQQGKDLCKDIKGSLGQIMMQLGIKMAKEALKSLAKKLLSKVDWGYVGELGAKAVLSVFVSPVIADKIVGSVKKIFGGGAKPVAIKSGGPLESLQKKFLNKECLIKPFVRAASAMMIRSLTTSIVTWIQGYDPVTNRSNVGFVGNFKQSLRQELDQEAGIFLNKLTNVNLCGGVGFQRFLKLKLSTPYGYPDESTALQRQLGCTATDIVRQAEYDYRALQENFTGGWPKFLRYALEPQNNPYGAYLIALDAKVLAETEARESFEKGFLAGGGFLGFTTDEYRDCRPITDQATINNLRGLKADAQNTQRSKQDQEVFEAIYNDFKRQNGIREKGSRWEQCSIAKITRTPGQTTAFMLNKIIGSGIDQATVATEMDNLISATINATINRIVGGSGGRAKGIFQNELASAIDRDATKTGEEYTDPISIPILELIIRANLAMAYLDKNILIPTLDNMAYNLSPVGSEQFFPGQIDPYQQQGSSLTYQGAATELREEALGLSRQAHIISQSDFMIFRDAFRQKQQIQAVRTQLMERLFSLIEDGENLQSSSVTFGLTTLSNSLGSAISGLPLSTTITLYGFEENNLSDSLGALYESASDAGRKIISLNNLNLSSLPALSDNFQARNTVDSLTINLNSNKSFLENAAEILDPSKTKELYLDELFSFLTNPTTQNSIREVMKKTLEVDEDIVKLLGAALAIPQEEFTATTTPTKIGVTPGQQPAPGQQSPGYFIPDFEQ